jgi:hypothetical protein
VHEFIINIFPTQINFTHPFYRDRQVGPTFPTLPPCLTLSTTHSPPISHAATEMVGLAPSADETALPRLRRHQQEVTGGSTTAATSLELHPNNNLTVAEEPRPRRLPSGIELAVEHRARRRSWCAGGDLRIPSTAPPSSPTTVNVVFPSLAQSFLPLVVPQRPRVATELPARLMASICDNGGGVWRARSATGGGGEGVAASRTGELRPLCSLSTSSLSRALLQIWQ